MLGVDQLYWIFIKFFVKTSFKILESGILYFLYFFEIKILLH